MKKDKKILFITQAAIIAALYVALTYAQNILLPGTTSMAVQFRASEAMTLLACFTPAAIPGLTLGCLIFNISNVQALPLDWAMGTAATLLATLSMWALRKVTIKEIPFLAALMPAVFNGIIVGLELQIFIPYEGKAPFVGFIIQAGLVALGELGVCCTLGLLLSGIIIRRNMKKQLFEK